jgi:3-dehydroquinate synthase
LSDALEGVRRAIVVTDETVGPLWLERLRLGRGNAIALEVLTVPAGESTKSWPVLTDLIDRLLALKPDRRTLLVALGGGVIGDLTGFVAAITLRGLDFIQIPTTLLSQVDSSVGGKTAINTPAGKNLVGAFHQPRHVLIDVDCLDTLSRRERLAGYAEVVKYGVLGDADFFAWLEAHGDAVIDGDPAARIEAVRRSCAAKARIVASDEREQGDRALLNLGHTFGHALEAATGFGDRLLHGEAVAIGMVMALALSEKLLGCPPTDRDRLTRHLKSIGLPVSPREIGLTGADALFLLDKMGQDKKVLNGGLTFILARSLGDAVVVRDVPAAPVLEVLEASLNIDYSPDK